MKNGPIGVAIALCMFAMAANGQRGCFCKENLLCLAKRPNCARLSDRFLCPATCGVCERCKPPSLPCEIDTCFDAQPLICRLNSKYQCVLFPNMCRKSCGKCTTCRLPPNDPKTKKCSLDCEDNHDSCEYWKKQNHCGPKSKFPHVNDQCPRACGKCIPCKLPPTQGAPADIKISDSLQAPTKATFTNETNTVY